MVHETVMIHNKKLEKEKKLRVKRAVKRRQEIFLEIGMLEAKVFELLREEACL